MKLDPLDRHILNILQSRFPLTEEPFAAIAQEVGTSEGHLLQRLRAYKTAGVLRQISAIFDTRKLGYQSILVAVKAAPARLDEVAEIINRHPGVSHNYGRTHGFNLWFTLAVHPDEDLEQTIDEIMASCQVEKVRLLPMVRFFKIGVNFNMDDYRNDSSDAEGTAQVMQSIDRIPLSDFDIAVIRELQEDLPLEPRPFQGIADRLGITEERLFTAAADLQARGAMRRFSAVLHHRRAGITANAMVCWRVPADRAEDVGAILAARPEVSHCYQRPTYPDWPYSHFSMVHARKRSECEAIAYEVSARTGIDDYVILMSTKEFKKTRVRYFVEHEWRQEYQSAVSAGTR